MSVKVMGLVWDEPLKKDMKFVLLAYADHADHNGGNVYPSVKTISKKTGYDERSVQRITTKLEASGYLILDGNNASRKGGQGKSTHWRIPVKDDKLSPIPKGDKTNTKRVTKRASKGDTVSPDPSYNHHAEPSIKEDTPDGAPANEFLDDIHDKELNQKEREVFEKLKSQVKPTPQQQMVETLSFVTGFDLKLHGGRLGKAASKLLKAGYTHEYVKYHYTGDRYWYKQDWRGKKDELPTPEHILETIGKVKVQNGHPHEPTAPTPEELAALRASVARAKPVEDDLVY